MPLDKTWFKWQPLADWASIAFCLRKFLSGIFFASNLFLCTDFGGFLPDSKRALYDNVAASSSLLLRQRVFSTDIMAKVSVLCC